MINQLAVMERPQTAQPDVDTQFADIMSTSFSPTEQAYFSGVPDSMQAYLENYAAINLNVETLSADGGPLSDAGREALLNQSLTVETLGSEAIVAAMNTEVVPEGAIVEAHRRLLENLFGTDEEESDEKPKTRSGFILAA